MTATYKNIADAHARITQLEQANAALHQECDVWWEALSAAVKKNEALQAEVARLTAITTAPPARDFATQQRERGRAVYRPKQPAHTTII